MFKKIVVAAALIFALMVGGTVRKASAQDAETTKAAMTKTPEADTQRGAYRLDFSINELQDGKRINTRQYSMNLDTAEGRNGDLKIGTRVPIEMKQGELQYVDLGTSISARIQDRKEPIDLSVRAEISNFAVPDQNQGHDSRPILRQLKIEASTVALLGKPMVLGSVDDPDSKRTFQLEVTVTKLR
jgi:hypothetical protein